ncbi:MAG: cytochrome c biogenesis protein CcsA [Saprospiraceae bacterium]|nr:cytochrome c biogenesis protein CcsA [Saprospiraceae bacterium]
MLYDKWWKILAVILFIYILFFGILIPLKPGILNVSPSRFNAGDQVSVKVEGYNSFFLKEAELWRAFIKIDSTHSLQAYEINVISDTELSSKFNIPANLPSNLNLLSASFILDHPKSGAMLIPSKIILSQDSINLASAESSWLNKTKLKLHYRSSFEFPYRNILYETIRNTFYHVSLWFAMFIFFGFSVYHSIKFLKHHKIEDDLKSNALVNTGILFGILGLLTGSLWARFTWDTWWTKDIKLNMSALTMLIYIAYIVLRASIQDIDKKRRISSAYNIFALVAVIPLIFVLPRLTDSLHPGNGGNPAFGSDDMDNVLRMVFYPSVIAFTLIGLWIASLKYRLDYCSLKIEDIDE